MINDKLHQDGHKEFAKHWVNMKMKELGKGRSVLERLIIKMLLQDRARQELNERLF